MATNDPFAGLVATMVPVTPSSLHRKNPGGWPAFVATHSVGRFGTPRSLLAVPFKKLGGKTRFVDAAGAPSAEWMSASKQFAFTANAAPWGSDSLRCTFTSDLRTMGLDPDQCDGAVVLFIALLAGQSLFHNDLDLPPGGLRDLFGQDADVAAPPRGGARRIDRIPPTPVGRRVDIGAAEGRVAEQPMRDPARMPTHAGAASEPSWVALVNRLGEEDLADALAFWA